jgi:Protein of unknown function (DUF3047)
LIIYRRRALSLAAVACVAAANAALAAPLTPPVGDSGAEPLPPWRVAGLPQQNKPLTRFTVVALDNQRVLRVEADHAYGNLVHPLKDVRAGTLAWRWRVDQPAGGADLHRKSGDDAALKVCASFDMPAAQVPFVERQLLRIASARAGEKLPTATLCYVWDERLAQGTLLHNAFTHRVRYIVSHGTPQRWSEEKHDLAADFQRAFGDDTRDVPPLTAVAIGADTDNTASHSIGHIDALRLIPNPP